MEALAYLRDPGRRGCGGLPGGSDPMGALGFWPVMLRWLWEKVRCLTKTSTKRSP